VKRLSIALTISLLVIFSINLPAQELDDFAEEDAAFMAWGRLYQSIFPLIKEQVDWEKWETKYDSIQKFERIDRIKGEEIINVIFDLGDPEDADTLDVYPSNLTFLDYNNDGFEDLIFQQGLGYRGHTIKMYRGDGYNYHLEAGYSGMIVKIIRDVQSGMLSFIIYNYPCCDGFVHSLYRIEPAIVNDTVKYQLTHIDKFLESNLKRIKMLPKKFNSPKPFTTKSDVIVLYRDRRPIYLKFEPYEGYKRKYQFYYPFALLPEGTKGVVLNQTIEPTKNGSDTLVFVKFRGILDRTNSIRHFTRIPMRTQDIPPSLTIDYYGWIDKNELEIKE
jgi:hypothetical protein